MLTSIIIPTWGATDLVTRCLGAIKQHTPQDYEVIVVDNGSQPRGCVAASNQGLRAARGDLLIVMNDDCLPHPYWLGHLMAPINYQDFWIWGAENKHARLSGHCIAFSREGYEALRGFNERFIHWCADQDLELRAIHAGHPPIQIPYSLVVHASDDPLRTYNRYKTIVPIDEWYERDMKVWKEIWGKETPADHWPTKTFPFR